MKESMRAPTPRMIKKLKECLEKDGKTPVLAEEMKSSLPGLYKRGMVETKMELINDKRLLCIYITDSGKKFLDELHEN